MNALKEPRSQTGDHTAPAVWFLVGHLNPLDQSREPAHIPITTAKFSIGRRPNAALCLPHRTISSHHAEIENHGNKLILRDLGSTNGTYVNGDRLQGSV